MYYSIAVFPSEPIQQYADQFRRRYDPNYTLIKPHLTLHEPQVWTNDQLEAVKVHLHDVTQACGPLELSFNRFATFYPANNVIYMALMDSEPMNKLYQLLSDRISVEPGKPYLFTPHVTVAQGLGDDELLDVFASLKQETLNYSCTINQIKLLHQTENGRWNSAASFPLRSQ